MLSRLKQSLLKYQQLSTLLEEINLYWIWIAKVIMSKKRKTRGITVLDFKLYYKAIVTKQYGTGIRVDL